MVTQKEYLDGKRAELKDATEKYEAAQAAFDRDFVKELEAIEALDGEVDRLENLMKRNRRMVAAKVSEHPDMYEGGASHYILKSVRDTMAQRFPGLDYNADTLVWRAFHATALKVNATLEAQAQALRQKRYDIEGTKPFSARRDELEKLKDSVGWLRRHIEHLSDLSVFRQWAKDYKQSEAANAVRQQKEAAEKALQVWLETEVFEVGALSAKAYKAE